MGKSAATLTFQVLIALSIDVFEVDNSWTTDYSFVFFKKKKSKEEEETAFVEEQGSTPCTEEGKNKQHIKQRAPERPVEPSLPHTGQEAARGRCHRQQEEQCKLLKHLTHWKDPEDGFAQTTNASLQKGQASSYPG